MLLRVPCGVEDVLAGKCYGQYHYHKRMGKELHSRFTHDWRRRGLSRAELVFTGA